MADTILQINTTANPAFVTIPGNSGGALIWNITPVQEGGDTYIASPNDFVRCDATLGNVGVVLPDAITCEGESIAVKDWAGINSVNIKITTAGGFIDGSSTLNFNTITSGNNFGMCTLVSDGSNWMVGGSYAGTP